MRETTCTTVLLLAALGAGYLGGLLRQWYRVIPLVSSRMAFARRGHLLLYLCCLFILAIAVRAQAQTIYTITPSAGANGTISPSTAQTVTSGNSLTFIATPNTDYTVNTWSVDGTEVQTGGTTFILTNITADHAVTVTFTSADAGRGDWWMFHHDPQHTGRSAFSGPSSPALQWKYDVGVSIQSSPAIGMDGTIYVGLGYFLYALNPASGSLKWRYLTGNYVESSPAIGVDGTIYIGSEDDNLYALNPADGSLQWKYATGGKILSSPAIGADGTVYVGSNDGNLYVFNPTNGSIKWKYAYGGGSSSPAIGLDGTIYVGSYDGYFYALNTADAKMKWSYAVGVNIQSSPAIGADGTIYIGLGYFLYAFNPVDGALKWRYLTGNYVESSPAIGANGTIYVGSEDGNLYALNPADGSLQWKYATGVSIYSSPAIGADGTIYVGSGDENLYALNPADGSLKWKYATGSDIESSPAIGADGTIYIGSNDENLYAITQGDLVTPNAGANGVISPNTPQTVAPGTSLTLTATPNTGYMVNTWSVDGTVTQTGGTTFTLTNIIANHTVQVTFTLLTFTVTPASATNGAISPSTVQTVTYGSNLTLTATPNTGYTVNTWSVDRTDVQIGGTTFTLNDITANHTVTVTFTLLTVSTVSLTASPTSPQVMNTAITLSAIPIDNGGQVQYLFRVGYTDAAGWHWMNINSTYTTTATCTWTPTVAGIYTLVVWAREVGHSASYDAYTLQPYQVTPTPISDVTLNATPLSPRPANTLIQLTATPTGGGGQVQYLFRVGCTDAAGWHWTNLTENYTTATCAWLPATAGTYTLLVWARLIGHSANYDKYASLTYQIFAPLSAVTLATNPSSPQPYNTTITLTATPTGGGGQVQYLFRVGYTDAAGWHWTNFTNNYTTTAVCTWTPVATGTYTLVVWARLIGHSANYDQYAAQTYQVTVPPFTKVTLIANPTSPQPLNTAIQLIATPTGGGDQVQYLFQVGYLETAGWHWTTLTANYTTTASCTWIPSTVGTYTLVVWARLIGHTTNYDQYAALTYQVTVPPITMVMLSTIPVSPQPANTSITLTATPTGGGGQVQYLFRVGYTDTAGLHWTNLTSSYTTTATCSWTPTITGTYTLVVWARVIGHTVSYDRYAAITYQVIIPPITAVALNASPASPQSPNTPITLAATPTGGGGQVQYLFRVGFLDAAGWYWMNLNGGTYTTTATCTWTPTTVGTYTLVVWARIVGHTANYDQYQSISYKITASNNEG